MSRLGSACWAPRAASSNHAVARLHHCMHGALYIVSVSNIASIPISMEIYDGNVKVHGCMGHVHEIDL